MSVTNNTDFAGSLMYNLNFLIGTTPTLDDMVKYSDVVYNSGTYKDYVTLQPTTLDGTATSFISYDNTIYVYSEDEATYETGDWFLFGQTWLPFFPPPSVNGQYQFRKRIDNQIYYNKARMGVLLPTMITVGKLAGITAGVYFGGKMAYKLAKNR